MASESLQPLGEVEADDRARISLGRMGVGRSERFSVSRTADGSLLLTPLASVPRRELVVWQNQQLRESLARGLADVAAGKVNTHGSFKDYADDFDEG